MKLVVLCLGLIVPVYITATYQIRLSWQGWLICRAISRCKCKGVLGRAPVEVLLFLPMSQLDLNAGTKGLQYGSGHIMPWPTLFLAPAPPCATAGHVCCHKGCAGAVRPHHSLAYPSHPEPLSQPLPLLSLQLGLRLGMKGLQYLSGQIPSWLSYAERERLEVRCPAAQTAVKLCRCSYS